MNKPVFYILIGLWLCYGFTPKAQENLVPNGSFEEYSECPLVNELYNGQFERAIGWWRPTMGTPDFFHSCNNSLSGVVGVPHNFWGHQEAYHGDGYVGLVPMAVTTTGSFYGAEYIQTRLNQPLKPCFEYYFTMHVSLTNYASHSLGRLGALFSVDTSFNSNTNLEVISRLPQVFYSSGQLSDTVDWMKIDGTFIANGYEEFLTIGYFFEKIINDTLFIQQPSFFTDFIIIYYYIDSVSLFEIGDADGSLCEFNSIKLPNVFSPNNDGINDLIDISIHLKFIKSVDILNRWGGVVTELNENNTFWDGGNCPDGVYYYIIRYRHFDIQETGFIHLIR